MKILAIAHEKADAQRENFAPHLRAETARVLELQQQDFIREIYFRADIDSALIILEAADVRQAEELLNTLPLVQNGLIQFEFIPLKPYPGFAMMFKQLGGS